jgi:hypothetical protein
MLFFMLLRRRTVVNFLCWQKRFRATDTQSSKTQKIRVVRGMHDVFANEHRIQVGIGFEVLISYFLNQLIGKPF